MGAQTRKMARNAGSGDSIEFAGWQFGPFALRSAGWCTIAANSWPNSR